jgi:pimeloyl-ACP methyl ester carboxylesterase
MLGKLVDVGGYRVHIYCTGEGSPTIVVAGGGFSFDWGLVQPEAAKFTRICTYDTAGTAWSDGAPSRAQPYCANRVSELHALLKNAGISSPYVLVGFSIGGLVARLYASRYPQEIAGMVVVDHAFLDTRSNPPPNVNGSIAAAHLDSPPVPVSNIPLALDLEDDENFSRLPERDQGLHRWALSIHSLRPTSEMAAECFSEIEASEQSGSYPLGNKPVAVVSTLYDSRSYAELQHKLLMLSRNSEQFIAGNSSHMVIIDQPEIVVQAIQQVTKAVKDGTPLKK